MTDTKVDPWALLREARDFMRQAAIARGPCPDCTECDHRDAIIAKVDAALAAHEADERVEVRWEREHLDKDAEIYVAQTDERTVLDVVQFKGERWRWSMSCAEQGYCDTLDEAKAAAIAAARGLK